MTYLEKLKQAEWQNKRHRILRLDYYHCKNCLQTPVHAILKVKSIISKNTNTLFHDDLYLIQENGLGLQVHHTYYIIGKEPWEYPEHSLVTLCPDCHKKIHQNNQIPIYSSTTEFMGNATVCGKCEGQGFLPEFEHIEEGICFDCRGEGIVIDNL